MPNPAAFAQESVLPRQFSAKFRWGFWGQLAEHKGAAFLAKAFKNWPEKQAELLIAGSGEQSAVIGGLAKDDWRIKILGKINSQELAEFFRLIDVLIVPSIWWENSPTVIAEAYAFGVPVLVSDAGGSQELVQEGKTGWVFKSGCAQDLLAKFEAISKNRGVLPAMAENCQRAVRNFSLEKYLDNLLELCRTLKK